MANKMDNKGQSGQHKRLNANKKANTNQHLDTNVLVKQESQLL